ncbi:mercury resistance transcriptional regulator SkgA [Legionella quinlivanii]|uniref:Mercury resistance transcriptional regulator SkgA n=2 Tax=Legionella quinlivanii TaxID=45073 RepID=A0A0W0Y5I9_9GAMM|nr:MerR family transcriptional regulator [Legionella quinlivanii]KTD52252.1 mercury resistance transcriptional regulator SkgA [Legionella quinlivanii]SEF74437.1 DNA-binding transcriptional regulator, MerR family [Legionella quinlivanii DSM 21216]STY12249.1 transcriptional regulator SkgA, mercury resistanc [Legionella quinlivanii]
MAYTINQLAKLSGISTRTLRFYDEIGLLAPAYYGENQYRYYQEEQLLMLQQILFFRELGFPLNEIRQILSSDDFNKIESLKAHKSMLELGLKRTITLIKTIDKTISHLRGKIIMRESEMYEGFDPVKQQEHEEYMLNTGIISQKQIDDSWQRVSHWKKPDWEQFKGAGETFHKSIVEALKQGQKVDSDHVQKLIQQHYEWVNNFWTPTKETYLALGKMYLNHPDFHTFYTQFHPDLVEYLVAAMKVFAEQKLD